ncbi:MAG: hypothetical protein AB7S77_09045, partial [Desulfatirhabdiaceae bacterium]
SKMELDRKFGFYQRYGVEEYYIYDPDRIRLYGWKRTGNTLIPIANMNGWTSPRLKIRFELLPDNLIIHGPDGNRFLTMPELDQEKEAAHKRAEAERQRADAECQRADAERREKERLAAKLRELGIEI